MRYLLLPNGGGSNEEGAKNEPGRGGEDVNRRREIALNAYSLYVDTVAAEHRETSIVDIGRCEPLLPIQLKGRYPSEIHRFVEQLPNRHVIATIDIHHVFVR
jgi:hypothetical protein